MNILRKPVFYFSFFWMLLLLPEVGMAFTMPSISVMLDNISTQIPYLQYMVFAFCYVAGFFLIMRGVLHLKQYGEHGMAHGQKDVKPLIISFVIGAALIYTPSLLRALLSTFFGTSTINSYSTGNSIDGTFSMMSTAIIAIVQFCGLVAIVRGLLLFYKLGSGQAQQGTMSRAITHLIGGTLCLNIVGTSNVVATTLGISW